jgi:hypothetical protein
MRIARWMRKAAAGDITMAGWDLLLTAIAVPQAIMAELASTGPAAAHVPARPLVRPGTLRGSLHAPDNQSLACSRRSPVRQCGDVVCCTACCGGEAFSASHVFTCATMPAPPTDAVCSESLRPCSCLLRPVQLPAAAGVCAAHRQWNRAGCTPLCLRCVSTGAASSMTAVDCSPMGCSR